MYIHIKKEEEIYIYIYIYYPSPSFKWLSKILAQSISFSNYRVAHLLESARERARPSLLDFLFFSFLDAVDLAAAIVEESLPTTTTTDSMITSRWNVYIYIYVYIYITYICI